MPEHKKMEAREIAESSSFLRKLDNLWYHYKWQIVAVAFFAVLLTVCLVQCSQRESTDVTVTYACAVNLNEAQQKALEEALETVMPKDFDGDGEKRTNLLQYSVYTEEELKALYTYYDEKTESEKLDTNGYNSAKSYNAERIKNFQTYRLTGDCAIWFVSPYVYQSTAISEIAVKLSDICETVPSCAQDEYSVRLSDTGLYQTFDAVKVLPKDTLIVVTHLIVGETASEESFAECREMFRAILTYGEN